MRLRILFTYLNSKCRAHANTDSAATAFGGLGYDSDQIALGIESFLFHSKAVFGTKQLTIAAAHALLFIESGVTFVRHNTFPSIILVGDHRLQVRVTTVPGTSGRSSELLRKARRQRKAIVTRFDDPNDNLSTWYSMVLVRRAAMGTRSIKFPTLWIFLPVGAPRQAGGRRKN
jgi:hypothetical protein